MIHIIFRGALVLSLLTLSLTSLSVSAKTTVSGEATMTHSVIQKNPKITILEVKIRKARLEIKSLKNDITYVDTKIAKTKSASAKVLLEKKRIELQNKKTTREKNLTLLLTELAKLKK